MADDEMQESQQDPPDVSVVTGQQTATDVSDQDDSNIEVIGDKEEKQPLSGDALIRYFQLTYDSCVTLDSVHPCSSGSINLIIWSKNLPI